jgi:hypothetical protein
LFSFSDTWNVSDAFAAGSADIGMENVPACAQVHQSELCRAVAPRLGLVTGALPPTAQRRGSAHRF